MDSKTLERQKKQMLEFLDMYKSMPCLWDRTHRGYSIRRERLEAYKELLLKYREIDGGATLPVVKNRLDIIRNGFIRELKKVRLSKEISSDPSQQYIPRLWYYDSVTFLEDHYFPLKDTRPSNSSDSHYDNYEESQSNNEYDDSQTEAVYLEENSNSSLDQDETPVRKRRKIEFVAKPDRMEKNRTRTHSSEDLECIGKAMALQMKDLDAHQSAIAHKLISDAIFYAKLGKLTVDSHVALHFGETAASHIDDYS